MRCRLPLRMSLEVIRASGTVVMGGGLRRRTLLPAEERRTWHLQSSGNSKSLILEVTRSSGSTRIRDCLNHP